MTRWLTFLACMTLPAGAAGAQHMSSLVRPLDDTAKTAPHPNFRILAPVPLDPGPIRQSGMVVDTSVAPNATLGLGLFSVTKKRGFADWRPDTSAPKSRKVGVGFKMRF
jgi:hypothetical protein